jgi:hypothetical protein
MSWSNRILSGVDAGVGSGVGEGVGEEVVALGLGVGAGVSAGVSAVDPGVGDGFSKICQHRSSIRNSPQDILPVPDCLENRHPK